MALSNKLVSKFVKATKADTKTKKEKIVYGTIARIDNMGSSDAVYYAKIDGSSFEVGQSLDDLSGLIPISHFTKQVNIDEKVIITIKDNTAIVTGSISAPAVDPVQVSKKIDEKLSDFQLSSISIAEIQDLWK